MSIELMVAWRHLRDPERRVPRTLLVGLALAAASVAVWIIADRLVANVRPYELFLRPAYVRWAGPARAVAVGTIALGLGCTLLGVLFRWFTSFTAFSVFGVFLGTFVPVVTLSVMSGFETDLKSKIRGAKADVVITGVEGQPFVGWERALETMRSLPGVVGATPFIEAEVMIRSGQTPAGILLRGIDPTTAPSVLDVGRALREGVTLDVLTHPDRVKSSLGRVTGLDGDEAGATGAEVPPPTEPTRQLPAILLGEELYARILRLFVGDEVTVVCPDCGVSPAGPIPKPRQFRVGGHFYSGMYEYDAKLAYIALPEAQRFLNMPGEVTGLDVRTATPELARPAAEAARRALGPSVEVRSWEELNQALFLALRVEKIAMFVVLTLIALVASFSIVSNLFMLVTEKGREVAILKAMGSRDGSILRVFLLEGLTIGVLGMVPGLSTGVATCLLIERFGLRLPSEIYYIERLPVVMRPGEIATIAAVAVALCVLATLSPALMASRLRPVQGLRYE